MVEEIKSVVKGKIFEKRPQRIIIEVKKDAFSSTLNALKGLSFNRLTLFTAVDFIKENQFEIVALVYSDERKVLAIVKTRIPRETPEIETITNIYPNAFKYEVEMGEMFGIRVVGNPDSMKPFVLEGWGDLPPLRKDFDSIKYATEHYESRNVEVKYD
ncbi:NADH-quinone oxidoreductase subunit C [Caldisericum exile]|uniref:NuoC-like protein n=1 Tax=Caldisericum exile (strain DSM 21853 / NBRC 104410 / AZM16c01) TaxID=511051 RepID=A0A7U6JFS4_CALEA|nr:NADH-quinone oxidoreductase subunit C [Caldisericum exile]BAL80540.1 NuoC-like protein [Caldisericum exile AZM16c01]